MIDIISLALYILFILSAWYNILFIQIRPGPEELFREAHRGYVNRVPELRKLWDRCAHSGDHDLAELLQRQQDIE